MVFQERSPGLRGRIATAHHVFAYAGLADVDAELEEFAMDARSAPSGLSQLSCRISFWISFGAAGHPGCPRRTFQVQNNRYPLRCQAITVSGFTMQSAEGHAVHVPQNQDHSIRSNWFSFGLFTERCKTPS